MSHGARPRPRIHWGRWGAFALVVVAAGALQWYQSRRLNETARAVSMGELMRLLRAQRAYFAEHGAYADSAEAATIFASEEQVVVVVESASSLGFAASAQYRGSSILCAIYTGISMQMFPDMHDGVPACGKMKDLL